MATTVEAILGSSLLAYWHAADLSVGDGNAIPSWVDRINSLSMAQATGASQPIQRADYATTGYPAAEFDGANDFLSVTDASLDVSKFAFLCAVKQNTAASGDTVYNVGGATDKCRLMANSTTIGDFRLQNVSASTNSAPSGSSGINVVAGRCQGDGYFWIQNGSSVAQRESAITINTDAEHFMGCRPGPLQLFDGGIFAFCFVDLDTCSWYDVTKALVQMRNDFGLTIYDQLPAAPTGGTAGFTGIGSGFRGLGT